MGVWNADPVLFSMGSLQIRYYGICLLITVVGGYLLWHNQIIRSGRSAECARRFLLFGLIGLLFGGRIGHLLFYDLQALLKNPLEMFFFWKGGLASHGSAAGLLLALLIFSRQQRMSFLDAADRLSFSCAWGAAWVRIGNLFNSEIVGTVTTMPWGVRFPRFDAQLPPLLVPLRHPVQLYEAVLAAAVLAALFLIDRRAGGERRPRGLLLYSICVLLFTGRFALEFFKEYGVMDSLRSLLTTGQNLSLPFILIGCAGLVALLRQAKGSK